MILQQTLDEVLLACEYSLETTPFPITSLGVVLCNRMYNYYLYNCIANSSSRCGSSRSSTVSTRLSTTSSLRSETTWKY